MDWYSFSLCIRRESILLMRYKLRAAIFRSLSHQTVPGDVAECVRDIDIKYLTSTKVTLNLSYVFMAWFLCVMDEVMQRKFT